MKYNKCVPLGRARKELYQMTAEYSPKLCSFWTAMLNMTWCTGRMKREWQMAEAAQIDEEDLAAPALGALNASQASDVPAHAGWSARTTGFQRRR